MGHFKLKFNKNFCAKLEKDPEKLTFFPKTGSQVSGPDQTVGKYDRPRSVRKFSKSSVTPGNIVLISSMTEWSQFLHFKFSSHTSSRLSKYP